MKLRTVLGICLSLFTMIIVGCGGGGSSSSGSGGTSASGSAVKGPISAGTVQVFEIISSASAPRTNIPRIGTTVIASGTTAADGSFSLTIPPSLKNGGVLFTLTGGSYKDEATGATRQLSSQISGGLRAAFGNISGIARRGGALTVNITPYTELGVQSLLAAPAPTDAAIAAANTRVASTFGLTGVDIVKTKPFDATTTPPAGATQAQKDYAQALAILSQSQKESSGALLGSLLTTLLPDVNSGSLSGTNSAALTVALLNFLNSGTNLSGGTVSPITVTVTPSVQTTAAINSTVSITATVTQGGNPVPNGTEVKFSIKSGAGGNLSATVAATTNNTGTATVTLGSAIDTAAFVVTATAGGVSADTATVTFANPNKPGSIVLAANPASGVTNNQTPITLTATVSPAGQGGTVPSNTPVTFTILTGTGTLSSATANTSNGVASVTLNSTVAGTVTINATAGTAPVVTSNTVSASFINQPTLVTIKLATSGTLPANTKIGGINARVIASPSSGLSIADPDVTLSGVSAGSILLPNTTNVANVIIGLLNTTGFLTGEFATLQYHIAQGTFPIVSDFSTVLTGAGIIDTLNANIPGITVIIQSITIN